MLNLAEELGKVAYDNVPVAKPHLPLQGGDGQGRMEKPCWRRAEAQTQYEESGWMSPPSWLWSPMHSIGPDVLLCRTHQPRKDVLWMHTDGYSGEGKKIWVGKFVG